MVESGSDFHFLSVEVKRRECGLCVAVRAFAPDIDVPLLLATDRGVAGVGVQQKLKEASLLFLS